MDKDTELGDIEFPPGIKDVSSDMNPAELVKALKVSLFASNSHEPIAFLIVYCFEEML